LKSLRPAPPKSTNFDFKNFFCPRLDVRRLIYIISIVLILVPSLAGAAQVSLTWKASTGSNIAGYKMHYGNYSGSYQYTVNVGKSTSATISGLNIGETYYFAVTAHDTEGRDSDFSNEASTTIGGTPPSVQDLKYTPVSPCRIVDTRKSGGRINAGTQRNFRVYGTGGALSAQGGTAAGCSSPRGEPLAAHINMTAVDPTGKGNLQAFPLGAGTGAGLIINYNAIGTNLANAGTIRAIAGSGADITVTSRNASTHAVIDVLGYYYPNGDLIYTPATPCRLVDTRKSGGRIGAASQRNFYVHGSASLISAQGGNAAGCSSPLGEPRAVHINMTAVDPTGKGNLQAFPKGAGPGAGLFVNYSAIDTNLGNAGTVKTSLNSGTDITVYSAVSSAHTVIDLLGYYYSNGDLLYTPVTPCRIVDTRKSGGRIGAAGQRNFYVHGSASSISAQGGNATGCPSPQGEPLAAHINMTVVDPSGKGNLQAFPKGAKPGAGMTVNYNTIDTNLGNAGTVKTSVNSGTDITVYSGVSSAHTVIDVLGYYYRK
jgi:hypothetical protein